jgi:hypothetical protein
VVARLVVGLAIGLTVTASASAELVARVDDGLIAVSPAGRPLVAYVQGNRLVVAQRTGPNRWKRAPVAALAPGSRLTVLTAGAAGAAAVVMSGDERSLVLLRQQGNHWTRTPLTGRLPANVIVGWPGLALDRGGNPAVAYTRWNTRTRFSQLILARVGVRGAVRSTRVTAGGWPKSYTPPPAAPVVLANGAVHVVETYGMSGAVGTIEWIPTRGTWIGLFLSAGRGGFPIGPMFAARGGSVVYAAWTEAFPGSLFGGFPVTIATHAREITEDIVSERGVTSGLVMTSHGPAAAANEWVDQDDTAVFAPPPGAVWAGSVTGAAGSELDGRIAGLAAVPRSGAQDLLLARPGGGLSWFRTPGSLPIHVTLAAQTRDDGSVELSGRVRGARGGSVTIYRERANAHRDAVGTAKIGAMGAFSLVDSPRTRPTFYRAVYTDPATGIPYAKLLREPIG